jgi:hypothetical protein
MFIYDETMKYDIENYIGYRIPKDEFLLALKSDEVLKQTNFKLF